MLALHGLPLLLQVGVPLGLLAWQALSPNHSVAQWLTRALVIAAYLGAAHTVGLWLVLPWFTALILLSAQMVIVLWQVRAVRALPWRSVRPAWWSIASRASLGLLAFAALGMSVAARRPPPGTIVDLQFPLRDGVYYVAAGGSAELLNPHLMTLVGQRFETIRGQSYGVDLVKLGPFGLRARGLLSGNPARYAIYGDRVFAPCAGVVVQAADDAPDMPPPQPDRTRLPGNHVLIDCDGVHVLLAHLKPGSVRVAQSEHVTLDSVVGLVGNSGNTNEPHLHIHAQRPADPGRAPLSGDPVPIRFDGRYLVRNDRISCRIGP